jgi:hypothetical protein
MTTTTNQFQRLKGRQDSKKQHQNKHQNVSIYMYIHTYNTKIKIQNQTVIKQLKVQTKHQTKEG